jgi:hypothetical protein
MTVGTRKTVRDRLETELTTAYGSTVYAVFPYMRTGFEGKSPVVRVLNGGSLRPRVAGNIGQALGSKFRYLVQHFVLYNEADNPNEQEEAEDSLDALESILAQFVSDKDQIPGVWKSISPYDYSEPTLVKIGGFHYLLEVFGLEITIDG